MATGGSDIVPQETAVDNLAEGSTTRLDVNESEDETPESAAAGNSEGSPQPASVTSTPVINPTESTADNTSPWLPDNQIPPGSPTISGRPPRISPLVTPERPAPKSLAKIALGAVPADDL